jgi:hypothetical protein
MLRVAAVSQDTGQATTVPTDRVFGRDREGALGRSAFPIRGHPERRRAIGSIRDDRKHWDRLAVPNRLEGYPNSDPAAGCRSPRRVARSQKLDFLVGTVCRRTTAPFTAAVNWTAGVKD